MNQGPGRDSGRVASASGASPARGAPRAARSRLSMHDGVTVWCDCCSCEAEPYWAEVAGELGIDLDPDEAPARDPE